MWETANGALNFIYQIMEKNVFLCPALKCCLLASLYNNTADGSMALEELFWEVNTIATQRIAILSSHSEKWNESKHL